jgi:hypothetical protein
MKMKNVITDMAQRTKIMLRSRLTVNLSMA